MEKTNISFKKHPRNTGLDAVGNPHSLVDIKVNKKICGQIRPPSWIRGKFWNIALMVMKREPDDNPNCDWRWIFVKKSFDTEESARLFIKENIKSIMKTYTLRFSED